MAYKIIITQKFEKSAGKTSRWLEKKWSLKSALEFEEKLKKIITELSLNPAIGRLSNKKDIRSLWATNHNRVYYKISKSHIVILELFESKQNPKRNKYE